MWLDCASDPGGWSYLASFPEVTADVRRNRTFSSEQGAARQTLSVGGLDALRALLKSEPLLHRPASAPPFCGGWAGWISYDLQETAASDDSQTLAAMCRFDVLLAYCHADQQWWVCGQAGSLTEARSKIERLLTQIAPAEKTGQATTGMASCRARPVIANVHASEFERRVQRGLAYIANGHIYQVNLAQRFSADWELSEAELYLRLRSESPAQFGAFLPSSLTGARVGVLSISPELFLRVRGREVVTRPIKGTRPSSTAGDALRAARELDGSAKERAELNMIVDLLRNDLGRVCEYGSVVVASSGETQVLPNLVHRVATVRGRLRSDAGLVDLLQAAFPGGSVTGAPKIRAMQIIRELEGEPRGPYCGAIGWFSGTDMELSIAIRTALVDPAGKRVHYHAGSGIVADSDPRSEYEETLHKTRAFFKAINATLPPKGPSTT